jgi:hypothetical protein
MIWKVGPAVGSAICRIHFFGSYASVEDLVDWGEDPVATVVLDEAVFERLNNPRTPVADVALEVKELLVVDVFSVDDRVVVRIVVEDGNAVDFWVVVGATSCDVVAMSGDGAVAIDEEAFAIEDEEVVGKDEDDVFPIEREVDSSGHGSDQASVGQVTGGAHNATPAYQPAIKIFRNIMNDRLERSDTETIEGRKRSWLTTTTRQDLHAPDLYISMMIQMYHRTCN